MDTADVKTIEAEAWKESGLSPKDPPEKMIVYCIARAMYADYEAEKLTQIQAQNIKLTALTYFDMLQSLAHSNSRIITELSKLTAPRRELPKKSKAELLEIINRIEAIVAGLMSEYDGKLPEFLKIKEEENESV